MCYYDYIKDIIEDQSFVTKIHIPGYMYETMVLSAVSRLETCDLFFLCRIVEDNYLSLRKMNDQL